MASSQVISDVRPHDRFFFSDGSLYLLVENSLYCVHKYLFENHATMFPVRGLTTSRDKPYALGDVNKIDFDRFLATLYPRTLWVEETETTQDWISVLRLASKWGFSSLRSRAIPNIEQTIDSPIDMVTLGRQYDIPAFLLPGYAVLCQSNAPLSDEDGLRLGVEDVLKIYRIRHELHNSGTTHVPLEVAYAKVKESGLGAERARQELDNEQTSTSTEARSVTASQSSATENEENQFGSLMSRVDSAPLDVASTEEINLVSEGLEQRHIDGHSPNDSPALGTLNNGGSDVSYSMSGTVSNMNSGPSKPDREGFKLVEMLTEGNFGLVSAELVQWINTKDLDTLHQVLQLIVEKAFERLFYSSSDPYIRLCRRMLGYTQASHHITRLLVEKAMEGNQNCAHFCNTMRTDTDNGGCTIGVTAAGLLFSEHLSEVCQENLEALATSVVITSDHSARVRRLHLIEFIREMGSWMSEQTSAIENWVTALLDANDEEKVATLCMLMSRAPRLCTSGSMYNWLERVKNAAQETSKSRVRKLLEGVTIDNRQMKWVVAEPDEDCTVQ